MIAGAEDARGDRGPQSGLERADLHAAQPACVEAGALLLLMAKTQPLDLVAAERHDQRAFVAIVDGKRRFRFELRAELRPQSAGSPPQAPAGPRRRARVRRPLRACRLRRRSCRCRPRARSNTATDRPRRASRHAIDRPITPAPTTATSTCAGSASRCGLVGVLVERRRLQPLANRGSCYRTTTSSASPPGFGGEMEFDDRGGARNPSLRRYEPDQVRRISALTATLRPSGFSAPCRGSPWNAAILEEVRADVNR